MEHPRFFEKVTLMITYKTNDFGFAIIVANFHTCFVPLTNVYKPSLSIFNFTFEVDKLFDVTPFYGFGVTPFYVTVFFRKMGQ
jgi:hypothetical protein